jgi:ABC-type antimicrobial peptide transport system permease subunit
VSLVELSVTVRNCNCIVTTAFSTGDDYPTLAYPVVFTIENVLIVMGTIITLGFIASLIASSRVSKKLLD